MKYMGSKARHVKEIMPYLIAGHDEKDWFIEPFVGGANVMCEVSRLMSENRLGGDSHEYLISMWKAVSKAIRIHRGHV